MQIWLLNLLQGTVVNATLIRSIDSEWMQVRLEDGQRMSVPRDRIFRSRLAALQALAQSRCSLLR